MKQRRVASRELDAEIAEKVMGWTGVCALVAGFGEAPGCTPGMGRVPDYSSDIAAAFQVVEKMRERWWMLALHDVYGAWSAEFVEHDERHMTGREAKATAETAPLAICLAALAAIASEDGSLPLDSGRAGEVAER